MRLMPPPRPGVLFGIALAGLLGLALSGCDAPVRLAAAKDVQAFFTAVQADDHAAFDAHVDRPAIRADMRRQLTTLASGEGFGPGELEQVLGGRMADSLIDRMIQPESFRIVWVRSGMPGKTAPNAVQIAVMLRMIGADRACMHNLRTPDRCIMTFRDEAGTWKLVGVQAGNIGLGKKLKT